MTADARTKADDFVNSDEAQTNWAKDRLTIAVRVDPRDDGKVRMDSDLVWQLGLVKQH